MGINVTRSGAVYTHGKPGPKNCSVPLYLEDEEGQVPFAEVFGPNITVASVRADLLIDVLSKKFIELHLTTYSHKEQPK